MAWCAPVRAPAPVLAVQRRRESWAGRRRESEGGGSDRATVAGTPGCRGAAVVDSVRPRHGQTQLSLMRVVAAVICRRFGSLKDS